MTSGASIKCWRIKCWLWIILLCSSGAVFLSSLAQADDDLPQQETELLVEAKKQAVPHFYTLSQLARVREQQGRYGQARATWQLIKRLHSNKTSVNGSSAADRKYGEIADFYIRRLQRKQRLAANPPKRDKNLIRKLGQAARQGASAALRKEGGLELTVQADLDGDLLDEIFVTGKYGALGKRNKPFMAIMKWDGRRYKVAWHSDDGHRPIIFPYGFEIIDRDGDGWKQIMLAFEPETDNAATLYFNGTGAIILGIH